MIVHRRHLKDIQPLKPTEMSKIQKFKTLCYNQCQY